jgi:threonine dehydrogenase-like Zn-dependent dehydrogenase
MRVLNYPEFDRLEVRDLDVTPLRPDEVRVQVAACGLCGSELETFKNHSPRRQPPLVMGHEFCGVIAETGSEVRDWKQGARVVSNSLVPCGRCVRCARGDTHLCAQRQIFGMHRPGAFAEFVNVPARCLIPWPENLPAEAAAPSFFAMARRSGLRSATNTRAPRSTCSACWQKSPIGPAPRTSAVAAGRWRVRFTT